MSSIKSKNTIPEITIRKKLWKYGLRYRIHDKSVIGTPDITFRKKRIAIFVDGCFWHGCSNCYKEPKTNAKFWRNKISKNIERRKSVRSALQNSGWKVMEFWEHEIIDDNLSIQKKIKTLL